MVNLVKKFFGKSKKEENGKAKQETHDVRVATCALLVEIASVDGEFSDEEKKYIVSVLEKKYELKYEYVKEIIAESRKELEGSIDLWQFTNLINENYSKEEKMEIIKTVWEVVYADGHLDKHEDYLVHKLANLLHLSHRELINAKLKVMPKKG